MQDLNELVSPSSGWTLQEATAINENGQIVGQGTNASGQTHAFLLTPVPEPSVFAMLLGGLFGVGVSITARVGRRRGLRTFERPRQR